MEVNSLFDLISLRSAPKLSRGQVKKLQDELEENFKLRLVNNRYYGKF